RPSGKLRPGDPSFYQSQWSWNLDSLCAMYVNPRTISHQKFYQSDYDQSTTARKRADLCIVRETSCCEGGDTDGDGLPDLSVRSWYLSFDPRFGSPQPETWKGWDGTIKGNVSYTYSDMTGVSLRCAESGQGSFDAAGRVCPV